MFLSTIVAWRIRRACWTWARCGIYSLVTPLSAMYVCIVECMRSVGVLFARASSFVLVFPLLCSSRSAIRTPAMLYVVFPTISISMLTCSRWLVHRYIHHRTTSVLRGRTKWLECTSRACGWTVFGVWITSSRMFSVLCCRSVGLHVTFHSLSATVMYVIVAVGNNSM